MAFDYSASGLPDNVKWKVAAQICYNWLDANMKARFGEDGIQNFMKNQPITAARNVMKCDDWTEESVTLLLMGQPARGALVANPEAERRAREFFGDRTVDLLLTTIDPAHAADPQMVRDAGRIYLAEAISNMGDQMIGREKFPKQASRFMMHDIRKRMLAEFIDAHKTLKGIDPALDAIFEDSVAKAAFSLGEVDKEMAAAGKKTPPKGPGM